MLKGEACTFLQEVSLGPALSLASGEDPSLLEKSLDAFRRGAGRDGTFLARSLKEVINCVERRDVRLCFEVEAAQERRPVYRWLLCRSIRGRGYCVFCTFRTIVARIVSAGATRALWGWSAQRAGRQRPVSSPVAMREERLIEPSLRRSRTGTGTGIGTTTANPWLEAAAAAENSSDLSTTTAAPTR